MSDKPINDGGPAFPLTLDDHRDVASLAAVGGTGMSLRDYFAAHAPDEIWPWLPADWEFDEPSPYKNIPITRVPTESEERAYRAWERRREAAAKMTGRWAYADAMLKARER